EMVERFGYDAGSSGRRPGRPVRKGPVIGKPSIKLDRVLEALRRDIDQGKMQPGERYPVRSQLEKRFKVSWYTIHKAFEQLKHDGVVVSRKRGGTFVAEHPPHLCDYGLVFRRRTEVAYRRLMTRAASQLARRKPVKRFHTYLVEDDPDGKVLDRLVDDVHCRRLAGLVFFDGSEEVVATALDDMSVLPMVTVSRRPIVTGLTAVLVNIRSLVRMALDEVARRDRRRVALLGSRRHGGLAELFIEEAERRSLTTDPLGCQLAVAEVPDAVARLVRLMLCSDNPPEALVVADWRLFDGVAAAVTAHQGAGGEMPLVVTHSRADEPVRAPWEVVRIAFLEVDLMHTCTRAIDRARRGRRLRRTLRVKPTLIETPGQD
ncbi:MAG: winged helix-turn-helix domain-containing protein, partial [Planctomycetota bacterium]